MLPNVLLLIALLAAAATASPAPAPNGQNPGPYPPNDPLVTFYWASAPAGPTTIQVLGDYQTALNECRGVEARTDGFVYLQTSPPYPDNRDAWKARLYRDWGCTGAPVAEISTYHGKGSPYPDPADPSKPLVVKSVRLVPA
ncbi:hypothetical protein AMAG_10204 [Allomyces macrogynus ATCC 38327]|uniref:Uncharacterized protein n=1 Tax=Allomyces macrogynus (strain ATCC 38327) TaxID=578462 RepID=A0A0L0SQU5_ALLM3|nr:hypothetical protein AMAG_10204 [Allomyces macrogynus ATCC 38327]|eukprot:KNE64871.1 hypothetical protein AMAG_10204 [Allomyces macrogynus ATCC 38327]